MTKENRKISENELIKLVDKVNNIFNYASINKEEKTFIFGSLVLFLKGGETVDFNLDPFDFVMEVNRVVRKVFERADQKRYYKYFEIILPKKDILREKYKKGLVEVLELLGDKGVSKMILSGNDILGSFYQFYLKYGEDAKDMGIVLTPKHIADFASNTLNIKKGDKIFDPTCGTGSFLVSACSNTNSKIFLYGIEQQPKIAAMAVVNMILRGEKSFSIENDSCFVRSLLKKGNKEGFLKGKAKGGKIVDKVIMNPPFALKNGDEKEQNFVDYALDQLKDEGVLFAILPYSILTKGGDSLSWRREMLKENTLLGVVSLPEDLFYPVRKHTCIIYLKKGVAHDYRKDVFWIKIEKDGYVKKKNRRVRVATESDREFQASSSFIKKYLEGKKSEVVGENMVVRPVENNDLLELVPEVYLKGDLNFDREKVDLEIQRDLRGEFSFLIDGGFYPIEKLNEKIDSCDFPANKIDLDLFKLSNFFEVRNGCFIDLECVFEYKKNSFSVPIFRPTSNIHNIVSGWVDNQGQYEIFKKGNLCVATDGAGSHSYTYVAPVDFIPSSNVSVLVAKRDFSLQFLFYVGYAIRQERWRFSYSRKPKVERLKNLELVLPTDKTGKVDFSTIDKIVASVSEFSFLKSYFGSI